MEKIQLIAEIIGYVCLLATTIAAITPSSKDDSVVGKISAVIHKLLKLFPTIGINPATRILEEKLNAEKKPVEEKK